MGWQLSRDVAGLPSPSAKDGAIILNPLFENQSVAFEASGFLHQLVGNHIKGDRAKLVCDHLWGDTAGHACFELFASVAHNFVNELRMLASICRGSGQQPGNATHRVYAIFEGVYQAKDRTTRKRRDVARKAVMNGKFKQAMTIPDCLVAMVLLLLEKYSDEIVCVCPPAEADAQLAYMQVRVWLRRHS